ncbi:roadblock/LC7 domain-containing protein [Stenotrophomonas sp. NA06056]|uniref:roadblock/LC7 domain-containing protein n=1 Tax=Stenotrophomonas sp. NA06056 TaxID=2742129 RepID=UPI00158E65D8|nr:roadblock/LC7 domain-containing protein [Stenotrophomonas sp. NA06056]QKW55400.1 roadblock/LC7 domain-containing protein [Stenotrophomonas sp. NA06056]
MQRSFIHKIVRSASGESANEAPTYDLPGIASILRQARERAPGLALLMVSTADGRAVAEDSDLSTDGRRLAAMANSFLTLGETVSRELALSEADYATICTRQGNVVLIRIPSAKPLTLTAVASHELNMAVLLFQARECAVRLASVLRQRGD